MKPTNIEIWGQEEGDVCNCIGCKGRIVLSKPINCSCHISPPCNSCMDCFLYCNECDREIYMDEASIPKFVPLDFEINENVNQLFDNINDLSENSPQKEGV